MSRLQADADHQSDILTEDPSRQPTSSVDSLCKNSSNLFLEVNKKIKERRKKMLITTKVTNTRRLQNKTELVESLFSDNVLEPEYSTPMHYKDTSYDRYRTQVLDGRDYRGNKKVPPVSSIERNIRKITNEMLKFVRENDLVNINEMYDEFKIPKASGGFRIIEAPHEPLKQLQRKVKDMMNYYLYCHPHDSAYAYVEGRDTVKAIKRHQDNGSNWFLKMDLKDFFGSITPTLLRDQLGVLFPFALVSRYVLDNFLDALEIIAFRNNKLPQGTPLSPMLTNLVMVTFDYHINKRLPQDQVIVYTRYADDLLFSSRHPIDVDFIYQQINQVFVAINLPLEINKKKTRYGNKAGRNWNLGIMYNKDRELTVGYRRKKKIKTLLFQFYKCYNDNTIDKEFTRSLQGELAYMKNIEADYHNSLLKFMNKKYNFDFRKRITEVLKR